MPPTPTHRPRPAITRHPSAALRAAARPGVGTTPGRANRSAAVGPRADTRSSAAAPRVAGRCAVVPGARPGATPVGGGASLPAGRARSVAPAGIRTPGEGA